MPKGQNVSTLATCEPDVAWWNSVKTLDDALAASYGTTALTGTGIVIADANKKMSVLSTVSTGKRYFKLASGAITLSET